MSKVTIEEIAKKAKVSIATVSRVINAKEPVKEETKKRVLKVLDEYNYQIKPRNSLINSKKYKAILVCVPDFENPFNSPVIEGIHKAARAAGFNVFFIQDLNHHSGFIDYEEILKENAVAGIIIFCSIPNSKFLENLTYRYPVVMCSEYAENYNVSYVSIDDTKASSQAVDYLIATGCKKIGLFNCNATFRFSAHREKGYLQSLEKANLPVNPDWKVYLSSISYSLAYANALHILSQAERPDAIFACSDVFAIAIINAAKKLKLRVPEDLSVIGFDNIYLSTMSEPAITTIAQPSFQLGFQACELLLEKIRTTDAPIKQILLNTELIVRESTKLSHK